MEGVRASAAGSEINADSCSWYSDGAKLRWYRINGMKSPVQFAVVIAVPLEAANMYLKDSSFGTGISLGGISLKMLLNLQFRIIHWPGFYASDRFDYIGYPQLGSLAFIACGYLVTVLLLLAVIFIFRIFTRAFGRPGTRRPSLPDEPSEE